MRLSLFLLFDRDPDDAVAAASLFADGLTVCQKAEALGFDGVWVAEHHFREFGGMPNPAVFLAAAAARTTRIRLGPAVAVLPFHDPLQVAEDYAVVDRISNGRLQMGIGSGTLDFEFEGYGLDPAQKRERFDAAASRLTDLWREGESEGKINVATVQKPTPPIYLATNRVEGARDAGERGWGLLTLAAAEVAGLDEIRLRIDAHRTGLVSSGVSAPPGSAVMLFAHAAATAEQARREAASPLERFFETHGGDAFARQDPYGTLRERGTALLGSAQQVSAGLRRLRATGADEAILWMGFGGMPQAQRLRSMELIAEHRDATLFTSSDRL